MPSPLEKFQNEHQERWKVLVDIPEWEAEDIFEWVKSAFGDYRYFRDNIARVIEKNTRVVFATDLSINMTNWTSFETTVRSLFAASDPAKLMLFIDCVVHYIRDWSPEYVVGQIDFGYGSNSIDDVLRLLDNSLANGSKWRVVFERNAEAGIVERVDERLTMIAKELKNDHLTKAWNMAFSTKPEPAKAIEEAQRAIELVASEKGLTKTSTGVFGALLGDIRANPEKYKSAAAAAYELNDKIGHDPKNPDNLDVVFANWFWTTMDLIQKTHPARHASQAVKGFELDPAAGKQAVLMATMLCELIKSGSIVRA